MRLESGHSLLGQPIHTHTDVLEILDKAPLDLYTMLENLGFRVDRPFMPANPSLQSNCYEATLTLLHALNCVSETHSLTHDQRIGAGYSTLTFIAGQLSWRGYCHIGAFPAGPTQRRADDAI